MREYGSIVDRCFLCMILSDRGLLELPVHRGTAYPLRDREARRLRFADVIKERGLNPMLGKTEVNIVSTPVGKLDPVVFESAIWLYEAIAPLLWAIKLHEIPKYDGQVSSQDFHPLLMKHRTGESKIPTGGPLVDTADIEYQCEVAMLWQWRSREGAANNGFASQDAFDHVTRIFGRAYYRFGLTIPLAESPPRDFLVGAQRFNDLSQQAVTTMLRISKWRHHALEWLSNDTPWEEIDTST
jgi:hypothetical protein